MAPFEPVKHKFSNQFILHVQSWPGSNDIEGVLLIPLISRTEALPSDTV